MNFKYKTIPAEKKIIYIKEGRDGIKSYNRFQGREVRTF